MAKVEVKAPIIDEIKGYVEKASAVVLVDYRGLTVEEDTALRKQLREAGVVYKVYKNTYLKRAFDGTPVFFPGKSHGQRSLEFYRLWGLIVGQD